MRHLAWIEKASVTLLEVFCAGERMGFCNFTGCRMVANTRQNGDVEGGC